MLPQGILERDYITSETILRLHDGTIQIFRTLPENHGRIFQPLERRYTYWFRHRNCPQSNFSARPMMRRKKSIFDYATDQAYRLGNRIEDFGELNDFHSMVNLSYSYPGSLEAPKNKIGTLGGKLRIGR